MARSRTNELIRVGVIAVMVIPSAAIAHEWYPRECCHDLDCAPVDRAEPLPGGSLRLTSKVGTTVVPASFPRRQSPDHQMHICMARFSHLDDMRPVCLFVPLATMQPSPNLFHAAYAGPTVVGNWYQWLQYLEAYFRIKHTLSPGREATIRNPERHECLFRHIPGTNLRTRPTPGGYRLKSILSSLILKRPHAYVGLPISDGGEHE